MDDYIISFYNEKKEKKDFTIDKYFNCGSYGYVYKINDDKCLKLFSEEFYFQPDVLKIIREIQIIKVINTHLSVELSIHYQKMLQTL